MPGFVTHYLFGVNSYKKIKNESLRTMLKVNRNVYTLGLQGPDLFFFYLPASIGKQMNIGSILHKENTNSFFHEMIKYMEEVHGKKDFGIVSSYIQGFMGHYLLDSSLHPYVYSRVGVSLTRKTMGRHYGLETDIDREVLWRYRKIHQADFSHSARVSLSIYERRVIANLLHSVIFRTYGIDISVQSIHSAIMAFHMECAMLTDSTKLKYYFINSLEHRIFGHDFLSPLLINDISHTEDPCNESHREWCNPWDSTHRDNSSVYEIMEKSAQKYAACMELMQTALENSYHLMGDSSDKILSVLGNNSYTSGLDCNFTLKR